MDSKNIQFTIKADSQTLIHIIEVAEYLQKEKNSVYANKTAAIKRLLRLGYHTHSLLTAEKNPNIEPELLNDINQLACALHEAQERNVYLDKNN